MRGAAHRLGGVAVGRVFNMPYFGASGVSVPPKGVCPPSLPRSSRRRSFGNGNRK